MGKIFTPLLDHGLQKPSMKTTLDSDLDAPILGYGTLQYDKIITDQPRSSIKDWFRGGTVRGSVFNLCSATLGAGTLALPYAFSKTGVIVGTVMLIVAGLATIFSIELLIKCREATGLLSYEEMTVALFGKRVGLLVDLNIIIFCFGTSVAYCKALQGILNPVLVLAHAPEWLTDPAGEKVRRYHIRAGCVLAIERHNSVHSCTHTLIHSYTHTLIHSYTHSLIHSYTRTIKISIVIFWAAVMLPLSLIKTMNRLERFSFVGVAAICYLVLAGIVHR
jgi:hypothetical protein